MPAMICSGLVGRTRCPRFCGVPHSPGPGMAPGPDDSTHWSPTRRIFIVLVPPVLSW